VSDSAVGLDRFRGPEYRRLLAAARRSMERTGGSLAGRISVANPDDSERRAVIGITGIHQPASTKRLTVALADIDAAVSATTGIGLAAALAAIGPPLRDRPAETASLAAARAGVLTAVEASPLAQTEPWYREWLADLGGDGTITRLVNADAGHVIADAVRVLEYLAGRTGDATPIERPALAAVVTGDTKALNPGTTLATLVLRALALRTGLPRPASVAARRELWDACDVIVDDLASRVLVLNVAADGDGLGEWLASAARHGTPFQITLHQLATHRIGLGHRRLFGCENPAVLRRACTELGPDCPPLLCAEGWPSSAFHRLVKIAAAGGGELHYHGDFDWPGIAIIASVVSRHKALAWRMTSSDYLAGAQAHGGGFPLTGRPRPTPWDPGLAETMRVTGQAVYEEVVADRLLADLGQAARRPD
jgi:uncharacterized protein (TIGR02679 family)